MKSHKKLSLVLVLFSMFFIATSSVQSGVWSDKEALSYLPDSGAAAAINRHFFDMNKTGQKVVAWTQMDVTGQYNIYAKIYDGANWSDTTQLSTSGQGNTTTGTASVSINSDGDALVSWTQEIVAGTYRLHIKKYNASTTSWDATQVISEENSAYNSKTSLNDTDDIIATYTYKEDDGSIVMKGKAYNAATDTWSTITSLSTGTGSISYTNLSQNAAGNAFTSWVQSDGTDIGIYTSFYTQSSDSWSAATTRNTTGLSSLYASAIKTDLTDANKGIIVWAQSDGILSRTYVSLHASGSWSSEATIDGNGEAVETATIDVAMDSTSNDILVGWGTKGESYVNHYDDSAATWSGETQTASLGISDRLYVKVDYVNNQQITLIRPDRSRDLYYNINSGAGWAAGATLLKAVGSSFAVEVKLDQNGNATTTIRDSASNANNLISIDYAPSAWGTEVSLATGPGYNLVDHALAVSENGHAAVIWGQYDDQGKRRVHVRRYQPTTKTWSDDFTLDSNTNEIDTNYTYKRVDVNDSGQVIVIWQEEVTAGDQKAQVRIFDPVSETWSTEVALNDAPVSTLSNLGVSINNNGLAAAVFQPDNTKFLYAKIYENGTWSAATQLSNGNATSNDDGQVESNNSTVMTAWIEYVADATLPIKAYAKSYDIASKTWSTAAALNPTGSSSADSLKMVMNKSSQALAAWGTDDPTGNNLEYQLFESYYNPTAKTWSSSDTMHVQMIDNDAEYFDISLSNSGEGIMTWAIEDVTSGNDRVVADFFTASTDSWNGTSAALDDDSNSASIPTSSIDPFGSAFVLWEQQSVTKLATFLTNTWQAATDLVPADTFSNVNESKVLTSDIGTAFAAFSGNPITNSRRLFVKIYSPVCGDGIKEALEACDDNNTTDGDGCNSTCGTELCGNSIVDDGEDCDDGNATNGDDCSSTCQFETATETPNPTTTTCGNGVIESGEDCDDNNTTNDDGCSSTCVTETSTDTTSSADEVTSSSTGTSSGGCALTSAPQTPGSNLIWMLFAFSILALGQIRRQIQKS